MKKIFYFIMIMLLFAGCKKEQQQSGGIYGIVTDKATGEPIRSAGVKLNTGVKTVTGSEGQYEFTDIKAGEYKISVTKTGYAELVDYIIKVEASKTAKGDVQLENLPPALRIINDNRQDINELDFGSETADITRSFNIFNDSPDPLEWQITKTAEWIINISKTEGILQAGKTQSVVVIIDRELLERGENITTIHITSDNGSKQLTLKAANSKKTAILNTLAVTNIATTSAIFNGKIIDEGNPAYTERGFVYSTSLMPTIESTIAKITSPVIADVNFSANVSGLALGQTYYVRAYAINSVGVSYSSNEASFATTMLLPEVETQSCTNIYTTTATLNGNIISNGDPVYTERGFVYGITRNPMTDDYNVVKRTVSGMGTGIFSANITTGLVEGTIYYLRAYAVNQLGTSYGTEVSFVPQSPEYIVLQTAGIMVHKTDISTSTLYWNSANSLCEGSILGGFTGWRLPTRTELATLYSERTAIGGFKTTSSPYYWSSTVVSTSPDFHYTRNFLSGNESSGSSGSGNCYCRCVRSLE
ncbi:MAG: DUF1566 domain-containing protein [Prevotellaceae bacterium]|jgi:hypothetical protein|nr:DUF1566 domain-containing protein [Prevotellaceae bacterium]